MSGNSKNALTPFQLIVAQSMAGDVTSSPTNVQWLDNVSIQLNFSGTPTGTFSVQGSLDYKAYPLTGVQESAGNWITITTASASGAAGNVLFDLNQLSFPWVRVIYTRSGGSGTLDGFISAKAV